MNNIDGGISEPKWPQRGSGSPSVSQVLQAMFDPTPEMLEKKFQDFRNFTAGIYVVFFLLGPISLIRDLLLYPEATSQTYLFRLGFCIFILFAGLLATGENIKFFLVASAAILLTVVVVFTTLIYPLNDGVIYGRGGFMYFQIATLLVLRCFSIRWSVFVTILVSIVPFFLSSAGVAGDLRSTEYAALIAPACLINILAQIVWDFNYYSSHSMRRDGRASEFRAGLVLPPTPITKKNIAAVAVSAGLIAIAAYAAIGAGLFVIYDRTRSAAIEDVQVDAEAFARTYAANLNAELDGLLILLKQIEFLYDTGTLATSKSEREIHDFLKEITFPDNVLQIALVGLDGFSRGISSLYPGGIVDLTDREHIKLFLNGGRRTPFLSRPVVGKVTNRLTLQLVVPALSPSGDLQYLWVVSIDGSRLEAFVSDIHRSAGSSISVFGFDGYLRLMGRSDTEYLEGYNHLLNTSYKLMVENYVKDGSRRFRRSGQYAGLSANEERIGYGVVLPKWEVLVTSSGALAAIEFNLISLKIALALAYAGTGLALICLGLFLQSGNIRRRLKVETGLQQRSSALIKGLTSTPGIFAAIGGECTWKNREFLQSADAVDSDGLDLSFARAQKFSTQLLRQVSAGSFVDNFQTKQGPCEVVWAVISFTNERGVQEIAFIAQDRTSSVRASRREFQRSKLATLGEMASSMAHELTQPYNIIGLAVANLERRLKRLGGEVESAAISESLSKIELIESAVDRGRRVIDHMRKFSRTQDGVAGRCDVRKCILSMNDLIEERFRVEGIALRFELPAMQIFVGINEVVLEQVLLNIIFNAFDAFSSQKNRLAGHDRNRFVEVDLKPGLSAEHVVIEIKDNAGGVPAEVADRIFEPFFTTKSAAKGTGLGLSLCEAYLRDVGGSIDLINEPGQGCTFVLTILAYTVASDSDKHSAESPAEPGIVL